MYMKNVFLNNDLGQEGCKDQPHGFEYGYLQVNASLGNLKESNVIIAKLFSLGGKFWQINSCILISKRKHAKSLP